MEHNTVILPLDDYNELIQAKKDLMDVYKGDATIIYHRENQFRNHQRFYYTKDEMTKHLIDEKNQLIKSLNDSERELNELKSRVINVSIPQSKKITFWDWLNDKY